MNKLHFPESSCCSGGEKEAKPVKDKSSKKSEDKDKAKDGKASGKPSPYQVNTRHSLFGCLLNRLIFNHFILFESLLLKLSVLHSLLFCGHYSSQYSNAIMCRGKFYTPCVLLCNFNNLFNRNFKEK